MQYGRLGHLVTTAALFVSLGASGCGDIVVDEGAGDAAGVDEEPTCTRYCEAVQSACGDTGPTSQFNGRAVCEAYCEDWAQLPLGESGQTSGNSVACRTWHSGAAAADPATHCGHAGPTGGSMCGSMCENYCHLATLNCTGDDRLYPTLDACFATCNSFATDGRAGDLSGDTVQCRISQVGLAGSERPVSAAQHCPLGAASSSACTGSSGSGGPPATCESYCEAVQAACGGAEVASGHASTWAQFIDVNDCLNFCEEEAELELGSSSDTSGNTAGCRQYYAERADSPDAPDYCRNAGKSGGGVCGSWCDNYCDLAMDNCDDLQPPLFDSYDTCHAACHNLRTDGEPVAALTPASGEPTDNTVQCRLYYLTLAGGSGDAASQYCPDGAPFGGGACIY